MRNVMHTGGWAWIDTDGLNPEDRKRIAEVGFDKWLDEVSKPKLNLGQKFRTMNLEVQKNAFETEKKQVTEQVAQPTETKKVSIGKKGQFLADEFIRIAKASNNVVTLAQAKEVNPTAPSDLAYYARLRGSQITTEKKKGGGSQWTLVKE